MTSGRRVWLTRLGNGAILAGVVAALPGCSDAVGAGEEIGQNQAEIQLGSPTTDFPGVVYVQSSGGSFCTGTLISEGWVLTAYHCVTGTMSIKTDDNVDHAVDRVVPHPNQDVVLLHLTANMNGWETWPLNDGALPAVNQVCGAVGFGRHLEPDGSITKGFGHKRFGTEKILSLAGEIKVTVGDGLADHGDSGGPLLCNGAIAGTFRGWNDIPDAWDDETEWAHGIREVYYQPTDPAWISSYVSPIYREVTLQSGWGSVGVSTPSAGMTSGIVRLRGLIAGGTGQVTVLPAELRPQFTVRTPVAFTNGTGQLTIDTAGRVTVQADGATGALSLEGVSFPKWRNKFVGVTLLSGWEDPQGATGAGKLLAAKIDGIVYLSGAVVAQSTNHADTMDAFQLPSDMRPAKDTYVSVVMKNGSRGHVLIRTDGRAFVEADGSPANVGNALGFTSLDGVTFAVAGTSTTALTLQNGWKNSPNSTNAAAVTKANGVVYLKGAISSGTGTAFVLPAGFRPTNSVFVPAELCSGHKGALQIAIDGSVSVVAANAADGRCRTSLDSVTFVSTPFTHLALQSGWFNSPFSTAPAAAAIIDGIVYLQGGIGSNGSSQRAFRLPAGMRPPKDVYLTVDLLGGAKGTVYVAPSGDVDVTGTNSSSFTSLDGVSFAASTSGFTDLTLNGWTDTPFQTGHAGAINLRGVVHLKGAISTTGASMTPFVLPAAFRPSAEIFVTAEQAGGVKGELIISANGNVVVRTSGVTSDAQAMTSLDGIAFWASAGATNLTLKNGWAQAAGSRGVTVTTTSQGLVSLTGTLTTTGTTALAFTLPASAAPAKPVYLPINLCSSKKGRLAITPTGDASVVVPPGVTWSNAQCRTSLEGVFFKP